MINLYSEQKSAKPKHEGTAFNCPHCGVYAHQNWSETYSRIDLNGGKHSEFYIVPFLTISVCENCQKSYSVWYRGHLYYPLDFNAPPPEEVLPQDIKEEYLEARKVFESSPRLACSLLRYTTKKLIKEIIDNNSCKEESKGDNLKNENLEDKRRELSNDINALIKLGLPSEVGDTLSQLFKNEDIYSNNEGFFDPNDDSKKAIKLFELLNIIADIMFIKKRKVEDFCIYFKKNEKK